MRRDYFLVLIFVLISCGISKELDDSAHSTQYIIRGTSIRIAEIDPIGNFYIVEGNDHLSKYDSTGHLSAYVVNHTLGHIHSIDVGNPFKIMVFYRDQQTILLYDRTLSEIQRIQLTNWKLHDVTAACLSPDNAIWLFDGLTKVLLKTNQSGGAILTSDPFDMIRPGSSRPDFIYDADHLLLLKGTGRPISVFDDFGKYLYTTEEIVTDVFTLSNTMVVMGSDSAVVLYDISSRSMMTPVQQDENMTGKRVHVFANHFYVSDNKGIYSIYP